MTHDDVADNLIKSSMNKKKKIIRVELGISMVWSSPQAPLVWPALD